MTKEATLVERLRAACVGHPHAKIEWPHRILHEAADEISSLRIEIDGLRQIIQTYSDAHEAAVRQGVQMRDAMEETR